MLVRSIAAAIALFAGTAGAQDLARWGEAGGWDIMIDPTLGNGCLMQAEFEDGSTVRIGFDHVQDTAYLTVFNASWGDVVDGTVYPVSFTLDEEAYEVDARGYYLAGVPGIDVLFDEPDFLTGIAMRNTLTLSHEGSEVMAIDLEGSQAAVLATIRCDDEQGCGGGAERRS